MNEEITQEATNVQPELATEVVVETNAPKAAIAKAYAAQEKAQDFVLNETAVKIAVKFIKLEEGCELTAYPDPASDLSRALEQHNLLQAYKMGKYVLPENFEKLSGAQWSIGYGETQGVTRDTKWTQQWADTELDKRVRGFMQGIFKISPNLYLESPQKQAAITSLVYNIGLGNYAKYAISGLVNAGDHLGVAAKFKQYNMANGHVLQDLVNRRQRESDLYMSVTG